MLPQPCKPAVTSVFITEESLLRHSLWPGKQVAALLCLARFERLAPGEGCWYCCTV